jgi:hypothetical protein
MNEEQETITTVVPRLLLRRPRQQEFRLPLWEIDGTSRAKDELNWELVSVQEGRKLICAYPEKGLGRK